MPQPPILTEPATDDPLARLVVALPPLAKRRALPMSRLEMQARGWDEVDIVFVTGDAYIDHPSFAMAILGRPASFSFANQSFK